MKVIDADELMNRVIEYREKREDTGFNLGWNGALALVEKWIDSGSLDADMSKLVIMSTVNDPKSFEPSPDSGSVPLDAPAAAEVNADGLLPCPFCGCTDIDPRMGLSGNGEISAGCWNCGACSGGKKTEKESIAAWNTRAAGGGGE